MKTPLLKITGLFLTIGAALAAIALQVFGEGLVSRDTTPPHSAQVGPHVMETWTPVAVVHTQAVAVFLAVLAIGLLCLIISKRRETQNT